MERAQVAAWQTSDAPSLTSWQTVRALPAALCERHGILTHGSCAEGVTLEQDPHGGIVHSAKAHA